MATIIEQLKKIFNIKNELKETINGLGGTCDNNFTKYNEYLIKFYIEGGLPNGNYIEKLEIPSYVTNISNYRFKLSKFKEVVVPSSVQFINDGAFLNSPNLKKVTLGEGVMSIGNEVFYNCPNLEEINFS